MDGGFVNNGCQNGNSLFLVHAINLAGFPAPYFYEVNTSSFTIAQSGYFYASGSSDDFNAAIVANNNHDVFVTWSSTNASAGLNAQVRFSGRKASDALGVIAGGTALITSSSNLTGNYDSNFGAQRWGDYSAVTVDPTSQSMAWVVNENIIDTNDWGSRIGKIGF